MRIDAIPWSVMEGVVTDPKSIEKHFMMNSLKKFGYFLRYEEILYLFSLP